MQHLQRRQVAFLCLNRLGCATPHVEICCLHQEGGPTALARSRVTDAERQRLHGSNTVCVCSVSMHSLPLLPHTHSPAFNKPTRRLKHPGSAKKHVFTSININIRLSYLKKE